MESRAVLQTMEVLEVKPLTDLVSEAVIKVCYVSDTENRNKTVINKEVGRQIAATLPGAPVVGLFNKEKADFEEHSRRVYIEGGDLYVEDLTKPYGFVSPYDKPWYQDFEEDGVIRTYLMCKAYFWTRQYEEASLALNKKQSMELDENSFAGYYEGDVFIFTQAVLDKLCILGDDYEPCFEGARIISTYTKGYEEMAKQVGKTLGRRLYVMSNTISAKEPITLEHAIRLGWDLSQAVYAQLVARGAENYEIEGIYAEVGSNFVILRNVETLEFIRCNLEITAEDTVELGSEMVAVKQTWTEKAFTQKEEQVDHPNGDKGEVTEQSNVPDMTAYKVVPQKYTVEVVKEDEELIAKFNELEQKYTALEAEKNELQEKYDQLSTEFSEAQQALTAKEDAEKDEVIETYSKMLDQEDIQPIIDKKAEYSVETLEEKLAVVFSRKVRAGNIAQYQVDINSIQPKDGVEGLPDFMKQALEFESKNIY